MQRPAKSRFPKPQDLQPQSSLERELGRQLCGQITNCELREALREHGVLTGRVDQLALLARAFACVAIGIGLWRLELWWPAGVVMLLAGCAAKDLRRSRWKNDGLVLGTVSHVAGMITFARLVQHQELAGSFVLVGALLCLVLGTFYQRLWFASGITGAIIMHDWLHSWLGHLLEDFLPVLLMTCALAGWELAGRSKRMWHRGLRLLILMALLWLATGAAQLSHTGLIVCILIINVCGLDFRAIGDMLAVGMCLVPLFFILGRGHGAEFVIFVCVRFNLPAYTDVVLLAFLAVSILFLAFGAAVFLLRPGRRGISWKGEFRKSMPVDCLLVMAAAAFEAAFVFDLLASDIPSLYSRIGLCLLLATASIWSRFQSSPALWLIQAFAIFALLKLDAGVFCFVALLVPATQSCGALRTLAFVSVLSVWQDSTYGLAINFVLPACLLLLRRRWAWPLACAGLVCIWPQREQLFSGSLVYFTMREELFTVFAAAALGLALRQRNFLFVAILLFSVADLRLGSSFTLYVTPLILVVAHLLNRRQPMTVLSP